MKINKLSKKRSIILATSIGALLLIGGVSFALWQLNSQPTNEELTEQVDNTSAVQSEQVQTDEESNNSKYSPKLPQKSSKDSGEVTQSEKSNVTTPETAPEKPVITRAEQTDGFIKVVAILQQSSPGYCELRLTKNGSQTVIQEVDIFVAPSYYVCGFTVPRSELNSNGQWTVVVTHHIGGVHTNSNTKLIGVT